MGAEVGGGGECVFEHFDEEMRGIKRGVVGIVAALGFVAQGHEAVLEQNGRGLDGIGKWHRLVVIDERHRNPLRKETTPAGTAGVGVLRQPQEDGRDAFSLATWT